MEERDKEIRLYKCLLEIRDKQLLELQQAVDGRGGAPQLADKNLQIQTLMDELHVLREEVLQMRSTHRVGGSEFGGSSPSAGARGIGASGAGSHVTGLSSHGVTSASAPPAELEELRKENRELADIVLQKEKQIQAISSAEFVNSDIGALQLGARAISMYTESLQLRQDLKDKEGTISALQAESAELAEKSREKRYVVVLWEVASFGCYRYHNIIFAPSLPVPDGAGREETRAAGPCGGDRGQNQENAGFGESASKRATGERR